MLFWVDICDYIFMFQMSWFLFGLLYNTVFYIGRMHHRAEVFWYLYAVKHGCLGHKQTTEQKKLLDVFSDFNGIAISDSQKTIRKLSPLVCNAFMFCINVQFLSHGNPFWEFLKTSHVDWPVSLPRIRRARPAGQATSHAYAEIYMELSLWFGSCAGRWN